MLEKRYGCSLLQEFLFPILEPVQGKRSWCGNKDPSLIKLKVLNNKRIDHLFLSAYVFR
jgi:hypothetical protein